MKRIDMWIIRLLETGPIKRGTVPLGGEPRIEKDAYDS